MGVTLKEKGNQNKFRNLFHPAQDPAGNFYFLFQLHKKNKKNRPVGRKHLPCKKQFCPAKGPTFVIGGGGGGGYFRGWGGLFQILLNLLFYQHLTIVKLYDVY